MTLAEVARNVGGSITDISKIMSVKEVKLGNNVPCYYMTEVHRLHLILLPIITITFVLICLLSSKTCIAQDNIEEIAHKYKDNGFIESISYDVITMNPIFNQDSISSNVIEQIFDGLVGADEDGLITKGRLAESWEIYEEVYLMPNTSKMLPNGKESSAADMAEYLKLIMQNNSKLGKLRQDESISNIKSIDVINNVELDTKIDGFYLSSSTHERTYLKGRATIKYPKRVRITLKEADESFRDTINRLLGADYFNELDMSSYFKVKTNHLDYRKDIVSRHLKAVEENLIIIFSLRKNVVFHDGHKFDSDDVKFTYEAIVNPKNKSHLVHDFEPIKNIDIIDKYTIKITYSTLLSSALKSWSIGILPEHLLNDKALYKEAEKRGIDPEVFSIRDSKFFENPTGTGPYKFLKRVPHKFIVLEKNSKYYNGGPLLKNIVYLIASSSGDALDLYNKGIIDYYSIPYSQLAHFKENKRQYIFSGNSYSTTYIGYNSAKPLFQDKEIRRALSMALNVEEIIIELKLGHAVRTTGLYPKNTPYYNKDIEPIEYNPHKAKEILASKGWKDRDNDGLIDKDGKAFSFTIITNDKNRYDVLMHCQKYWKNIGVGVYISFIEWEDFVKRISSGNFEAAITGLSMGIDPDLYPIYHSSQTGPNQLNFTHLKNEKADKLMELIRRTLNKERQIEYAHQLQKVIYEDQPYTFLYVSKWYAALNKQIVIADRNDQKNIIYSPVKQAPSGDMSYYFNKWVKLPKNGSEKKSNTE